MGISDKQLSEVNAINGLLEERLLSFDLIGLPTA